MAGREATAIRPTAQCYHTLTADRQTADADVMSRDRGVTALRGRPACSLIRMSQRAKARARGCRRMPERGASVALRLHAILFQASGATGASRALLAEPLPALGSGGRKWAYGKGRSWHIRSVPESVGTWRTAILRPETFVPTRPSTSRRHGGIDLADRPLPPQPAGMSRYSADEEITSICADLLVELRGIEPLTSAVRLQRSPI
jgi:hypothetical protein